MERLTILAIMVNLFFRYGTAFFSEDCMELSDTVCEETSDSLRQRLLVHPYESLPAVDDVDAGLGDGVQTSAAECVDRHRSVYLLG